MAQKTLEQLLNEHKELELIQKKLQSDIADVFNPVFNKLLEEKRFDEATEYASSLPAIPLRMKSAGKIAYLLSEEED